MQVEIISVHRDGRILELDDELYAIALGASREIQQRMLVETQLSENASRRRIRQHSNRSILK